MNNDLIKRIDLELQFTDSETITAVMLDCRAEILAQRETIERLNKYVPMTASEVDSLWLEAEVCRGAGLEVVK